MIYGSILSVEWAILKLIFNENNLIASQLLYKFAVFEKNDVKSSKRAINMLNRLLKRLNDHHNKLFLYRCLENLKLDN